MMGVFELRIRFPLGTYTGHRADGSADYFPDPARVYSALTQSAFTGTSAVVEAGRNQPSPESRAALRWFETHPPDALHLPRTSRPNPDAPIAFRKEGLIPKEGGRFVDKTSGKATDDGVSVDGVFGMSWNEIPPDEVVTALDHLCAEVSHIGEALSPAVLEVARTSAEGTQLNATWLRDPEARRFTRGGIRVRIPQPGRLDELQHAHEHANPLKPPTVAGDKHTASESSRRHPVPESMNRRQRYVRPQRVASSLPWTNAIVIAVDELTPHPGAEPRAFADEIPEPQRVAWCVALHRALVKRISGPAPSFITGRYPDGLTKPANRLALQYLDPALMAASRYSSLAGEYGAFLLLLPALAASDDLLALEHALIGLREIRSRHGFARVRVRDVEVSCEDFWNPPAAGMVRLRSTIPAMIADIRRQRSPWSLVETVLASIGFTWRDQQGYGPVLAGRGERYRRLVDAVRQDLDPVVLDVHRLPVDGSDYVHRLPEGVPAVPFRALIDLGDHLPDGAMAAIGQSRHLGGGLLVPVDMPASLIRTRGESR